MKSILKTILAKITKEFFLASAVIWILAATGAHAQSPPYPDSDWPPTLNVDILTNGLTVDWAIFDTNVSSFPSTPSSWTEAIIGFTQGGDTPWAQIQYDGLDGDQATGAYMNIEDFDWRQFEVVTNIDILMQVWGNSSFYNANGSPVDIQFLEGSDPPGFTNGQYTTATNAVPLGLNNSAWNWVLFTITNAIDPDDGNRYIGDPNAVTQYGGINGGTIRIQNIGAGLTIRALALGPKGSFGPASNFTVFAPPPPCAAEPPVNLAYLDINHNITNNLVLISNSTLGYTYVISNGIGPSNDLRTAIQCTSGQLDFGILSNYLGLPCNTAHPMKLCVEFYDDPALKGTRFYPTTYSTDATGDTATSSATKYTTTGSGQWLKLAFWVSAAADLDGVNTAPLQGGPILLFATGTATNSSGGPINGDSSPFIDRIELGVVRSGTNVLAGLDPEPNYYMQPFVCQTNYGYYAEWAPYLGITNNLNIGSTGGDQNEVLSTNGPPDDQRLSWGPQTNTGDNNIQFSLKHTPFGPAYQDNFVVSMVYTYYDDPNLAGASIYPQVYTSYVYGVNTITFPVAPYNTHAYLQGTGRWVDAYFVLPNVETSGVNQANSIVRFETTPATSTPSTAACVQISRVRYDVIRPCGPWEGINYLQDIGTSNNTINWFGTAAVMSATNVLGPYTNTALAITTNYSTNSYTLPAHPPAQFFKLSYPNYPTFLANDTNTPPVNPQ